METDTDGADTEAHDLLQLTRLILRLSRSLLGVMDGPLEQLELSTKDLLVLNSVARGYRHPGRIAERLNMAAPSVSRSLDKLVELKLIARSLDAGDRRRFTLSLTPLGERTRETARRLIAGALAERYAHVPEDAVVRAAKALAALSEKLEPARA